MEKQSKTDSMMEVISNVSTGFFISWGVMVFIVSPAFGLKTNAGEDFLITTVFTVTSIIRSYIIRRVFNGRSVWQTLKGAFA